MPLYLKLPRLRTRGLSLAEMIMACAIVLAIGVVSIGYVANYITTAQTTANKATLTSLNQALESYRIAGGMRYSHSLGGTNNAVKYMAVLDALKRGFTADGYLKTFWNSGNNSIDINKLTASGTGNAMVFTDPSTASSPFDKTNLIAWYNFNDNKDSCGNYNLTEVGTPTYSQGYGISSYSSNAYWSTSLNLWSNISGNKTFVIRARKLTGTGTYVFQQAFNNAIRYVSPMWCRISALGITTNVTPSLNTWYTSIVEYNATTNTATATINDVAQTPASTTFVPTTGTAYFGGEPSQSICDTNISYAAFFNRLLTAAEKTRLYNNGNDIQYSDLQNATPVVSAPDFGGSLQNFYFSGANTASRTLTLTKSVPAGTRVALIMSFVAASTRSITGATDNKGNTWNMDLSSLLGSNQNFYILSSKLTSPLNVGDSITISLNGNFYNSFGGTLAILSNVSQLSSSVATTSYSTTPSASLTVNAAPTLLIYGISASGITTPPTGTPISGTFDTNFSFYYRQESTTGSKTVNATISPVNTGSFGIAAYK